MPLTSRSHPWGSIAPVLFLLLACQSSVALDSAEPAPREHWTAEWISHPTAPLREPRVFHFRKIIHLDAKPSQFPVEVSGDNHFLLYVNGMRIGEGPAKGDLPHWRYETFDLAPALHAGDNVIAATVFNFGIYAPVAVICERTALLMQGDSTSESVVNTLGIPRRPLYPSPAPGCPTDEHRFPPGRE